MGMNILIIFNYVKLLNLLIYNILYKILYVYMYM